LTDLTSQIKEKAGLATSQFQGRARGALDYSEKRLEIIEEMLEEASKFVEQMPPKDSQSLIELMGSYILEVAHRGHGGNFHWHEQSRQPVLVVGEPLYQVAIMTFDKVRGRLTGDKANNIPFFYGGFAARVRSAGPGTKAFYV
jgi:hypothetical protein